LDARSGWTESPLRYRTENSTKSLCQLQDSERNAVAKLERLDEGFADTLHEMQQQGSKCG
jgi:hypothetical protein